MTTATGCGHDLPDMPNGGAAGYGTSRETGLTFCYPCLDGAQRIQMAGAKAGDRQLVYVDDSYKLTTWTGGLLAYITRRRGHKLFTPSGTRYTLETLEVRDLDGGRWHGRYGSDHSQACILVRSV